MLIEFRIVCEGEHTVSKHLESLHQNLLNGKLPHNLSWAEAVELVEHLGEVQPHGNDEFAFVVNGQSVFFKKPHTHDLGVEEISRLRKFLKEPVPDAHKSGARVEEPAQPGRPCTQMRSTELAHENRLASSGGGGVKQTSPRPLSVGPVLK
jgi:hypothetical protein